MKDLNECKAEIFRRSEKRIKARRRVYNSLLVLCIPAVVIIAVLPIIVPMNSNNSKVRLHIMKRLIMRLTEMIRIIPMRLKSRAVLILK